MRGFLFLLASCSLSLSSPEACLPVKLKGPKPLLEICRGWGPGRRAYQQEATEPRRELLFSNPQAHPPFSPLAAEIILNLPGTDSTHQVLYQTVLFLPKSEFNPTLSRISLCCCSVPKLCPTLCDHMDCSTPGSPVLHYLPEFAQTLVH